MFWSNLYGKKCIFKVFIEEKKGKKCIFKVFIEKKKGKKCILKVFIEKKKFQLPSLRKKFFLRLDKSQVSGKNFFLRLDRSQVSFSWDLKKVKDGIKNSIKKILKDWYLTSHWNLSLSSSHDSSMPKLWPFTLEAWVWFPEPAPFCNK